MWYTYADSWICFCKLASIVQQHRCAYWSNGICMVLNTRKFTSRLRGIPGMKVTQNNGTRRPWRTQNRILHRQKLYQFQCCTSAGRPSLLNLWAQDTCLVSADAANPQNVGSPFWSIRRSRQNDESMENILLLFYRSIPVAGTWSRGTR
jgi:hypothetical protein